MVWSLFTATVWREERSRSRGARSSVRSSSAGKAPNAAGDAGGSKKRGSKKEVGSGSKAAAVTTEESRSEQLYVCVQVAWGGGANQYDASVLVQ